MDNAVTTTTMRNLFVARDTLRDDGNYHVWERTGAGTVIVVTKPDYVSACAARDAMMACPDCGQVAADCRHAHPHDFSGSVRDMLDRRPCLACNRPHITA